MASACSGERNWPSTPPELAGAMGRARLVVLGCEVGGRWSTEASSLLSALAEAKARCEPEVVRKSAMVAWLRRWSVLMHRCSCFRLVTHPQMLCFSAWQHGGDR